MSQQRIRILDAATIAQIAAGEVIERPVSVVKELVENSLDAGASSVIVECEDGGRGSLTVIDDGAGIARDDLPVAFARHATSKLRAPEDLFAIGSLGFRGEGLASIAAAASVEMISRTAFDDVGAAVRAQGTRVDTPSAVAAPVGTKVTVNDLFALTPARRAFLKSGRAEFARIASFLSQLSLGWPRVGFTLRNDGRTVWVLPPVEDPRDRLEIVFGKDARGSLTALASDQERGRERIGGYVSVPGRDRSNRSGQVFFVNGRLVRSPALSAAWLAAHGAFAMTGRYPFGAIDVRVPPEDVDVNVHPTKIEVRFANAQAVFEAVRRAVARALRATEPARILAAAPFQEPEAAQADIAIAMHEALHIGLAANGAGQTVGRSTAEISFAFDDSATASRIAGQIDRTFIAVIAGGELLLIDQHAAHERIAYEALLDRESGRQAGLADSQSSEAAPLLFPTIVELTPERAAVLHEVMDELEAAGIVVEPFGDRSFRVAALPAAYEPRRFDLEKLLDDLSSDDAPREGLGHRNRILATIACHSVVRAGEALAPQEQASLYQRLLLCRDPHSCPHGRPTMLRLDRAALARAFKRA